LRTWMSELTSWLGRNGGVMVPAMFVIDDFLRNADEVRRQALGLTYAVGGRYPGLNSIEKLRIEGLDQVISTLVREPVRAPWTEDFSHGSCRVALASEQRRESTSIRATGPASTI
jgi:hypothetical protein